MTIHNPDCDGSHCKSETDIVMVVLTVVAVALEVAFVVVWYTGYSFPFLVR